MPKAPREKQTASPDHAKLTLAHTIGALRAQVDGWRADQLSVALVPTMGALHDGHLSLVRHAKRLSDKVVVSIFLNPTQFAAHEDLGSYPRQEDDDIKMIEETGGDLVYLPTPDIMYPEGYQTSITVNELSQGLCGASRPHFFGGVATVVCKLLNQARPDIAVFGEKDFQQLLIIKRMVKDLDMNCEIIGAPIIRHKDGLAMSSRNAYLSPDERQVAAQLNKVIATMSEKLIAGERVDVVVEEGRQMLLSAGFPSIDYLEVRDTINHIQEGPGPIEQDARIFAAANLGRTRLIDNWPVKLG